MSEHSAAWTKAFKAYDIRGLVPVQLDAQIVRLIGRAFAVQLQADTIVVGRDMRVSSPELAAAFIAGACDAGADVIDVGLTSTDGLYFASGAWSLPGAMITASHNPGQYNGIKLCGPGAVALSRETGLSAMCDRVAQWCAHREPEVQPRGSVRRRGITDSYADLLIELAPVSGRPLRVVIDAGNGMAGLTAPRVLSRLDLRLTGLHCDLDGTFPHHPANPLDHSTLVELQREVVQTGADLGLAFDGDADRCFVIDERGSVVSPSALTALIAERYLRREPGARVIHNLICSRAVPEVIAAHGGMPVRTQVGHSLIKATMAEQDAVFGGEHSGHFYFRDFWFADSGMLAALHVLGALAGDDRPVSELMAPYDPYVASGEINRVVDDPAAVIERLARLHADFELDYLDGLTVSAPRWWFNVRASNTEPVLRLNVEAEDQATVEAVRDRTLDAMT